MPILPYAVLAAVLAYLMGAIPFAYIVARMRSVNIFEVGSGNMGTTNVIRAVGPVLGISVLVLDMLKGIGAIFLARALLPTAPNSATAIAAIFVILGHNWSIFAYMVTGRLRGGKGAATAFGTFLIISPPLLTVVMLATGVTILVRTRYMSLAVLVMTGIAAGSLVVLGLIPGNAQNQAHMVYALTLGGMIFYRHRENIKRLLAGNERRVGERA